MNKNNLILTVLVSSLLVTGNNFMKNNEEKIKENKAITTPIASNENTNTILNDEETDIFLEQDNSKYTLCSGAKFKFKDEKGFYKEVIMDKPLIVTLLEINDKYATIMLPNGISGKTYMSSLVKCVDLYETEYKNIEQNNMVLLDNVTKVYDESGMYLQSKETNTLCYVKSSNGKYAKVLFEDGTEGYVSLISLSLLSSKVDGFAYIRDNTYSYNDKDLNQVKGTVFAREIVYVSFINDNYAYVTNTYGESFYMNVNDLDENFIIINLNNQKMYCFLDFKLVNTYGTRTGRDSSPTHTGDFDIDWKAENWEFTTFPGSYANHWIPINEFGEGIHDLIGDNEANYGNDDYHIYGSHGCIRVPAEASEFVYNNYNVGDMVLVRKK